MQPPRQILVVYKKSLLDIYAQHQRRGHVPQLSEGDWAAIRASHASHHATLAGVQAELRRRRLPFHSLYRARHRDYTPFDLIISVGGDGTLIEAARQITDQPLIGVNSDPERSSGYFCIATLATFSAVLDDWLADRLPVQRLTRMRLTLDGTVLPYTALNDVLVAHRVPAAMSRYALTVGAVTEAQRGAGLWLSTAAGATGAVRSAGGHPLSWRSRRLQYLARELYHRTGGSYRLARGLVPVGQPLQVRSLMREGMLYLDGPHLRLPFPHGSVLAVDQSPHPLPLVAAPR